MLLISLLGSKVKPERYFYLLWIEFFSINMPLCSQSEASLIHLNPTSYMSAKEYSYSMLMLMNQIMSFRPNSQIIVSALYRIQSQNT